MFSVLVFLFNFISIPLFANGIQLGEPVTDKTKDVLFRDMGQAYVSDFGIVDTAANLQIVLEDTIGVDEFWVVDFQPYDKQPDKLPVNVDTGDIEPENTGSCSNVIINGPFSSILGAGRYFNDDSNFRTINVSLTGPGGNGDMIHKRLFEHYKRGNVYNVTNQYGNNVQRRDDVILFQDHFEFFFNCTDIDDQLIWRYSNTTESIEFRTTLFLTNVRLRDRSADPNMFTGVSWISSSVELLYRIYRIAIVNFVISSSALVQPTLNYVIIKPYPEEIPLRDPTKAWIKMEFETLIESPDGELLSYIPQSLKYTSKERIARLHNVLVESDSSEQREGCVLISGSRCRQTWTFYLVLDLTGHLPVDDLPIDATGEFTFEFEKHACTDSTAANPIDCTIIPNINFTIALSVTIQTFVSLLDETLDEPKVILQSLQGANGEDLRGGALEDRRGVNHREQVTMVMAYGPELLHADFDLQLTLFMVCKQNVTALPAGCLDVETTNRYVAYYHNDFKYTHTPIEGEATTYELQDISQEWDPSAEEDSTQQSLTLNEFDSETKHLTIGFVSTALSQERLTYTITTVYKLVDTAIVSAGRRRRYIEEDKQVLVNSELRPYGETHTRQRRDLLEAAEYPQGHSVMLDFVGCPPRSTFNPNTLDCDCPDGEIYSSQVYDCYPPSTGKEPATDIPHVEIEEKSDDGIEKESSAEPIHVCFALHGIILLAVYCFAY
ncbi:uncharacterized protein [Amphiura filiformis]|uniref:uncharacterized protein n=1 Tax=Amphiura filiformis TaxID=82378 RepID=UPI003B20E383